MEREAIDTSVCPVTHVTPEESIRSIFNLAKIILGKLIYLVCNSFLETFIYYTNESFKLTIQSFLIYSKVVQLLQLMLLPL